jgi:hypothetical protein
MSAPPRITAAAISEDASPEAPFPSGKSQLGESSCGRCGSSRLRLLGGGTNGGGRKRTGTGSSAHAADPTRVDLCACVDSSSPPEAPFPSGKSQLGESSCGRCGSSRLRLLGGGNGGPGPAAALTLPIRLESIYAPALTRRVPIPDSQDESPEAPFPSGKSQLGESSCGRCGSSRLRLLGGGNGGGGRKRTGTGSSAHAADPTRVDLCACVDSSSPYPSGKSQLGESSCGRCGSSRLRLLGGGNGGPKRWRRRRRLGESPARAPSPVGGLCHGVVPTRLRTILMMTSYVVARRG